MEDANECMASTDVLKLLNIPLEGLNALNTHLHSGQRVGQNSS